MGREEKKDDCVLFLIKQPLQVYLSIPIYLIFRVLTLWHKFVAKLHNWTILS